MSEPVLIDAKKKKTRRVNLLPRPNPTLSVTKDTVKEMLREHTKGDNQMAKHIIAPDLYPPPRLPDLYTMPFEYAVQTLSLSYQYKATHLAANSSSVFGFSPAINYGLFTGTYTGSNVTGGTWAVQKHQSALLASYSHLKILGYKIVANVVSPEIDQGGVHGFFNVRPGQSASDVYNAKQASVACSDSDPRSQFMPVQRDAGAIWIGNTPTCYQWNPLPAASAKGFTSQPFIFEELTSAWRYIPWTSYVISSGNDQDIEFTVHYFVEAVQVPGSIPPALDAYNTEFSQYQQAMLSYKADSLSNTPLPIPPVNPLAEAVKLSQNSRLRPKRSKDMRWYDKVAMALTGTDLAGFANQIGKTALKVLPEIIAML